MKKIRGFCPLCGEKYSADNRKTRHHIFPKLFFGEESTLEVEVCHKCHCVEFNHLYRMDKDYPWTKQMCVWNWISFCKTKGKNALEIYPSVLKEVVG